MIRYLFMSLGPAVIAVVALREFGSAELAGAVGIGTAFLSFLLSELVTRPGPRVSGGIVRDDIVHALLSSGTAQMCLLFATVVFGALGRPQVSWPLWLQIVCIVVGTDFLGYLAHRMQHRVKGLWAAHSVHHTPSELYWLNGLRAHPGDTAWTFAISVSWAVLAGFAVEAFVLASVIQTSHLLLQHARAAFPQWLESIVVTPAWHARHHALDAESPTNLAHIFTVWDRLFGTFRPSTPTPSELGVSGLGQRSVLQELLRPGRSPQPQ